MYRMFWVTFSQKCVTMGTQVFKTKPTTIFLQLQSTSIWGNEKDTASQPSCEELLMWVFFTKNKDFSP